MHNDDLTFDDDIFPSLPTKQSFSMYNTETKKKT